MTEKSQILTSRHHILDVRLDDPHAVVMRAFALSGMTQAKFVKALGVSHATFYGWTSGKNRVRRLHALAAVGVAMSVGVPVEFERNQRIGSAA